MAGIGTAHLREGSDVLLRVEHLTVEFPAGRRQRIQAVSDVSLDIRPGETLGLVGESGCGKSTTARGVLRLERASGAIAFDGQRLDQLEGRALRRARARMKIIFQDPLASLNPRRRVHDIVGEPFAIWGSPDDADERIDAALTAVGLEPDLVGTRRPHQFSGGQCQRICIARALVSNPKLLVCDEAVSALDVSVQTQIVKLLVDLKSSYGLTLLFISHNLAVVKNISDRVAVMYLGRVCEVATAVGLYEEPAHPYTRALLESASDLDDASRRTQPGHVERSWSTTDDVPSPIAPPSGCRYRTRCPRAGSLCAEVVPEMRAIAADHFVACHFPVVSDSPTGRPLEPGRSETVVGMADA